MSEEKETPKERDNESPKSEDSEDLLMSSDIFEAIPEKDRKEVSQVVRQMMISGVVKSPKNPLQEKITSEHIGQVIQLSDKQDEREKKDKNWDRIYKFSIYFVSLVVILVIVNMLRDDKEILEKVITAIVAFAAGAGAGFGVGRNNKAD